MCKANGSPFLRPVLIDKTGEFVGDYRGCPKLGCLLVQATNGLKKIKKAEALLGSVQEGGITLLVQL